MVDFVGVQAADHAEFVGDSRELRQVLDQFEAGLAVAGKRKRRPCQHLLVADEGQLQMLGQFSRTVLAMPLLQQRLGVEHVEL